MSRYNILNTSICIIIFLLSFNCENKKNVADEKVRFSNLSGNKRVINKKSGSESEPKSELLKTVDETIDFVKSYDNKDQKEEGYRYHVDKFYEENKQKLISDEFMKESGSHGINEDSVNLWRSEMKIKGFVEFADFIKDNIKYISLEKFLSKLNAIAIEIKELITKYDNISFIIDEPSPTKSNTWIFLLVYGMIKESLRNKKCLFFGRNLNDKQAASDYAVEHCKNEKTLYLNFDDMSYSGTQLNRSLAGLEGKKTILDKTESKYYLVIPYIGTRAYNSFFKNLDCISLFKNTEKIKSIDELLKYDMDDIIINDKIEFKYNKKRIEGIVIKKNENQIIIKNLNNNKNEQYSHKDMSSINLPSVNVIIDQKSTTMNNRKEAIRKAKIKLQIKKIRRGIDLNHVLIYFDHKLADSFSVPHFLFSLGCLPGLREQEKYYPFIKNCKYDETDLRLKETCRESDGKGLENVCPKPFYKKIIYTFENKILEKGVNIFTQIGIPKIKD